MSPLPGEPCQHKSERDGPQQVAERQGKEHVAGHRAGGSRRLAFRNRSPATGLLRHCVPRNDRIRGRERPNPLLRFRRRRACPCWRPTLSSCPPRRSSMRRQRRLSLRQEERGGDRGRVPALLGRLVERFHPRLVVIACNTASTIALDGVRAALDLPVVGTVPAIKPAAEMSKTRVIGVLGTEATVRQPYVDRSRRGVRRRLHDPPPRLARAGRACRGEAARRRRSSVEAVRAAALPMFDAPGGERIDTIVLACTHFPLVEDELAAAVPGRRLRRWRRRDRAADRLSDPRAGHGRSAPRQGLDAVHRPPAANAHRLAALAPIRHRRNPNALKRKISRYSQWHSGRQLAKGAAEREVAPWTIERIFRSGDRSAARRRPLSRVHRHPAQQGHLPQRALLRRA